MDTHAGHTSAPNDKHAWERLGELLEQRRVALDPTFHSRQKFVEATGLNERLVSDLENARRTSYRKTSIYRVEIAYQIEHGSVDAALAGGDLTPLSGQEPQPDTAEPSTPPGIELPRGFDPSSLDEDEVAIFYLRDTPLRVRQILVQMRRVLMNEGEGADAAAATFGRVAN